MIVIETKLKKLPQKCSQCKYSYVEYSFGRDSQRYCRVSFNKDMNKPCPYEFNKEKNNWEYTKPDWCPLREVEHNE